MRLRVVAGKLADHLVWLWRLRYLPFPKIPLSAAGLVGCRRHIRRSHPVRWWWIRQFLPHGRCETAQAERFDDFIACAEFLIANKYTSPKKLAINGQSNGGLLVGATELQRPDLFGAVLAQVGVMDMLRFDKFNSGHHWQQEFGAPSDNEEDSRAILKYSPVQKVHVGTHYPPTFIATADHDDTVYPAHSFKFRNTTGRSRKTQARPPY